MTRKMEYYYAGKGAWYDENGALRPLLDPNQGAESLGFTLEGYVNSPLGEWYAAQYSRKQLLGGGDEMAPAVLAYWSAMGMKKQLFTDRVKFSLFTPMYQPEGMTFPVLFLMHMGGAEPYDAEWYGFVEEAARRGYIVVCPAWSVKPAGALEAPFRASGLTREAFVFHTVLEQLRDLGCPMDETRMYTAGISGGGNAAAFAAAAFPELIAATAPATGAAIQGAGVAGGRDGVATMEKVKELGMGLLMPYGLWDVERRWPISGHLKEMGPAKALTLQERLDHVNLWLDACGTSTLTTLAEVEAYAASGEKRARDIFGLNFDSEYQKELEVPYYFGDSRNAAGETVVRFMGVAQCPHYVSPSWAAETFRFFERFRRDPVTRKLIAVK